MSGVAPRRARRPAGKARRPRIPGVFERGATQPAGMHRPSNAARLSPRAAKPRAPAATLRARTSLSIARSHLVYLYGDRTRHDIFLLAATEVQSTRNVNVVLGRP